MLHLTKVSLAVIMSVLLIACGGEDREETEDTRSSASSSQSSSISSSSSSSSTSSPSSSPTVEQPQEYVFEPAVVIAINAGGPEFRGPDGTLYLADTHYAGGNTYATDGSINATNNDTLYQTERWNEGSVVYEIPLDNGVYDVVLKFAEIYHENPGARVFDVTVEGERVASALDLVSAAGARTAYDITIDHVTVNDGSLSISIDGSVDNAKIAGIVVYREPTGGDIYARYCLGCHGNERGENAVSGRLTASECGFRCADTDRLASYIDLAMPHGQVGICRGQCSIDVANYIVDNFAGYGANDGENFNDEVPIAGDIFACEQGEDAAFGGLKRITRTEYQNLVSQLFNVPNFNSDNLGTDGRLANFSLNVETPISPLQTDQYMEVGEQVAQDAAANWQSWAPCSDQNDQCVGQIIDQVVSRAYRRPVTAQERDRLMGIYRNASGGGFQSSIKTMLHAVLTSPNFLYHLEFGNDDQSLANGVVPLTSYEIAARLSFFLWRSAPDAALLQAAAADQLQTPEQIAVHARRMLQDERARSAVGLFHLEWLKLSYPEPGSAGEAQAIAAIEDTVRTVTELTYADNGDFSDLFFVSYGYLDEHTKGLYEVTGSPVAMGSDGFEKYALDPMRRGGILSRAGFLTFNSPPSGRGKFIREQLLCGVIHAPPADVVPTLPEGNPEDPPRVRWQEHVVNPSCGGCHELMDPLGFGLDNFDTDGKWRDRYGFMDNWDVDATGHIIATSDINGHFDGHLELQEILSTSADTRACYAVQWFRFAIGRNPGWEDSCSLAEINQLAAANDYNIRDVMIAITQSDAFRYRRAEPAQ